MLTVGSLFAGIGGFDLGLERAGMKVIWQSEIDPYASAVLKKHWPEVPNHGDIRTICAGTVERPDVLCGGFPCQDISNAGKRAGIDGERSGLWAEYARVIGELRPRYVIVENVAALRGRGIERVLGDLAALWFDAEWHCIPASAVGAPHRRDRVWIVAHARCDGSERWGGLGQLAGAASSRKGAEEERQRVRDAAGDCGAYVADADKLQRRSEQGDNGQSALPLFGESSSDGSKHGGSAPVADADGERGRLWATGRKDAADAWESSRRSLAGFWGSEPDVGRVAHGVPKRVDRLRCLGNSVVPQIVEILGKAIIEAERARC